MRASAWGGASAVADFHGTSIVTVVRSNDDQQGILQVIVARDPDVEPSGVGDGIPFPADEVRTVGSVSHRRLLDVDLRVDDDVGRCRGAGNQTNHQRYTHK